MQTEYYNNQIAVQLDEQTLIENVIVNTYKDLALKKGESVVHIFTDDSQKIFFEQFSDAMKDQIGLGKRVVLSNDQTAMLFMIKEEKHISLFAFSLGKELIELFDELIEINNEQIQSIRELYRKLSKYKDESKVLEEIMLVNNTLINTRRELSINNRKLKSLNDELERINNIDYLTKVANRRKFYKDINTFILENDVWLTMMDFNNFKYVNDNFGHDKGDDLLCVFTNMLEKEIDPYMGKLYRLGGDEFAILAIENDEFPIKDIFDIVNGKIKETYKDVSLAFGSVKIPKTIQNIDKVIEKHMRKADLQMYQMKDSFYKDRKIERHFR